jgi:transposase
MHESLLRRPTLPGTGSPRWWDVPSPSSADLPGQCVVHQTLESTARGSGSSAPQAFTWSSAQDWSQHRNSAACPTRRYPRCDLTRTRQRLGARAGQLAQSLDHEPRDCATTLVTKKKSLSASERDRWARAAFQLQIAEQNAHELVVVDEFGCNLDLTRRYARAPIGERASCSIARNTPPNQTIIASLHPGGMGPSMQLSGGTDTAAFAAYIEHVLGPTLRPGQIVLLDNLSAHNAPHIAALLAARGCRLWFLPAYSPDLSPIELAIAKVKSVLRSIGARTVEALSQAIAEALAQISESDAAAFFRHCGYWVPSPMAQAFCTSL